MEPPVRIGILGTGGIAIRALVEPAPAVPDVAVHSVASREPERAAAFAVWGATSGVAVALGPVVGGFLTTHYSWRWAFRINVVVAPLAILGALAFMRPAPWVAAASGSTSPAHCSSRPGCSCSSSG